VPYPILLVIVDITIYQEVLKMGSYAHQKRARKGRLINIVCVLYVKPVEIVLVLLTITRKVKHFTVVSVTPVLEEPFPRSRDGLNQDTRKRKFVKSADLRVNIRNSLMFIILTKT